MAINTIGFPGGYDRLARSGEEFSVQMMELANVIETDFNTFVSEIAKELHQEIVKLSPADSGTYIMNHGISNGPNPGTVEQAFGLPESQGGDAQANKQRASLEVVSKYKNFRWDGVSSYITFYNNTDYAPTIEFGGFVPDFPEKGSYVKRLDEYVVKSQMGFSKQAPHGVYILAVSQFMELSQKVLDSMDRGEYYSLTDSGGEK